MINKGKSATNPDQVVRDFTTIASLLRAVEKDGRGNNACPICEKVCFHLRLLIKSFLLEDIARFVVCFYFNRTDGKWLYFKETLLFVNFVVLLHHYMYNECLFCISMN